MNDAPTDPRIKFSTRRWRRLLIGLVACSGLFLPVDAGRISPLAHIAEIPSSVPVLFLAGTKDMHARISEVDSLQRAIESRSKLVRFEGLSHSRLFDQGRALYVRTVLELLDRL